MLAVQPEGAVNDLPGSLLACVFGLLDAKDLGRASGVCTLWRALASKDQHADRVWRRFYAQRWKVDCHDVGTSWHSAYGTKLQSIKSWSGRTRPDWLHGHTSGVRCCKLLPSHNLLATGSLDKTVRLWDLSNGMPLSVSKPHGGTVRCLALDQSCLASGGSDHLIRVWQASRPGSGDGSGGSGGEGGAFAWRGAGGDGGDRGGRGSGDGGALFALGGAPDLTLRGHTGPVSAMCLAEGQLWSGSWDYSVRVWGWQGGGWDCRSVLTFDDWVGSLAVRGNNLLVAAGPAVCVLDNQTGQLVRKFQDMHEGHVSCLEGSQNGRLMFTGSADGLVLVHDLRMRESSHVLWHHSAGVQGLAFEDPWLATASADGSVVMINTEGCMRGAQRPCSAASSSSGASAAYGRAGGQRGAAAPQSRQFQTNGPAHCVDLVDQYLVAGSESDIVRVWDFTGAAEAAERAAAAKAARNSGRAGRRDGLAGAAAGGVAGPAQVLQVAGVRDKGRARQQQGGGAGKVKKQAAPLQPHQQPHQQQHQHVQMGSSPPTGPMRIPVPGGRRGAVQQQGGGGGGGSGHGAGRAANSSMCMSPPGPSSLPAYTAPSGASSGATGPSSWPEQGLNYQAVAYIAGPGRGTTYAPALGAATEAAAAGSFGQGDAQKPPTETPTGGQKAGRARERHSGRRAGGGSGGPSWAPRAGGAPQALPPPSRPPPPSPTGGGDGAGGMMVLGAPRDGFSYRHIAKSRGPRHH